MNLIEQLIQAYQLVDLSHSLSTTIPTWGGNCGFKLTILTEHKADEWPSFKTHEIHCVAGIGTHIDAPIHCFADGADVANLQLKNLLAPCCVIDITGKARADYLLTVADLKEFEQQHGKILKNSIVVAYTGWDQYWHDPRQYRNEVDGLGLQFPGFSADAAEYLLSKEISGIGIDTLSPDGSNSEFPVHRLVLDAGKYILENLTNLAQLSASGSYIMALPIKIVGGTEAPTRVVAWVRKS